MKVPFGAAFLIWYRDMHRSLNSVVREVSKLLISAFVSPTKP